MDTNAALTNLAAIADLPADQPTGLDLPDAWGTSDRAKLAINHALKGPLKHGLMASIPIVCRGSGCPYMPTCAIPDHLIEVGQRCPVEIAAITQRFSGYMDTLSVSPDNLVDLNLLRNLVDIEVQILRADNKLAISADFIEEVVTAISPQGVPHTKPEISKAAEFKLKLLDQHAKLLTLLNATRQAKAGSKVSLTVDASSYAADLLARKAALEASGALIDMTTRREDIVDAEFVDTLPSP